MHTGGSSAVEQRTVKCASAYAVILWSGVQIPLPDVFVCFFFLCPQNHAGFGAFQTDEALRSHDSSVHSTRVVFIPSKDKIRVRVPMDAHGGLLYMVAYNLRKVENRDRYPDPPYAVAPKKSSSRTPRYGRGSLGAIPSFGSALFFLFALSIGQKKWAKKGCEARGIRTPNLWVWNPTRCHCAIASCPRPVCALILHLQCPEIGSARPREERIGKQQHQRR